jgi:hypothetical protein
MAPSFFLAECSKTESASDWISLSGTTESLSYRKNDTFPRAQYEYQYRRKGDLLDISAKEKFQDSPTAETYVTKYRFVYGDAAYVGYQHLPNSNKIPTSGIGGERILASERIRMLDCIKNFASVLDGYIDGSGDKRFADVMLDAKDLRVSADQNIDGIDCKLLEATTPLGAMKIWIAPSYGCLPLRMEMQKGPTDLCCDGRTLSEEYSYKDKVTKALCGLHTILDQVKVSKIEGVWIPVEGRLRQTWDPGEGGIKSQDQYNFVRTEITLRPDFSRTDAFKTDLPNGSLINNLDEPNSGVRFEWRDGKIVRWQADAVDFAEGKWPTLSTPWWRKPLIIFNVVVIVFVGTLLYIRAR